MVRRRIFDAPIRTSTALGKIRKWNKGALHGQKNDLWRPYSHPLLPWANLENNTVSMYN
jgi:hypothetical protein